MSMLTPLPATERALRDTLVARSGLPALDGLAFLYGLPRPTNIDEDSWRTALRQVIFGPKGTRGNTHAFLEAAWAQYNTNYTCTVAPGAPQTLTWTSGGAGGFTKANVGRLYRVVWSKGSHIFRSVGPTFIGGNQTLTTLALCPVSTAYWQGANFAVLGGQEAVTVTLLPFMWTDFDARFLLAADVAGAVPPTYMQPQVRWGASAAGGAAGNQATLVGGDGGDMLAWQEPALGGFGPGYTVTAETAGTWRNLIFNADHDPNNPAAVPARGGTYDITILKNGAATALTCTIAANSKVATDMTHNITVVAGDIIQLYVAANAGVNQPLVFPHADIYIDRPNGEPDGGYILPDAAAQAADGQVPIYLDTALDFAFMSDVRKLLAAGVVLEGEVADFTAKDSYW